MRYVVALKELQAHCRTDEFWRRLLDSLWVEEADDTGVSIQHIFESLGLDGALWALQALPAKHDNAVRLLACDLVAPALRYNSDPRIAESLRVARAFAHGEATESVLSSAFRVARDAVLDAKNCAAFEAASAVRDAASSPARSFVYGAALSAADAAAYHGSPHNDEAWNEAWEFARAEQARIMRDWLAGET